MKSPKTFQREAIRAMKEACSESFSMMFDPFWRDGGYNYGAWAFRGCAYAVKAIQDLPPQEGESVEEYADRLAGALMEQKKACAGNGDDKDSAAVGGINEALSIVEKLRRGAACASGESRDD